MNKYLLLFALAPAGGLFLLNAGTSFPDRNRVAVSSSTFPGGVIFSTATMARRTPPANPSTTPAYASGIQHVETGSVKVSTSSISGGGPALGK